MLRLSFFQDGDVRVGLSPEGEEILVDRKRPDAGIIWGWLTTVAHKPSIEIEQATSSYSFRSPELSQPI